MRKYDRAVFAVYKSMEVGKKTDGAGRRAMFPRSIILALGAGGLVLGWGVWRATQTGILGEYEQAGDQTTPPATQLPQIATPQQDDTTTTTPAPQTPPASNNRITFGPDAWCLDDVGQIVDCAGSRYDGIEFVGPEWQLERLRSRACGTPLYGNVESWEQTVVVEMRGNPCD